MRCTNFWRPVAFAAAVVVVSVGVRTLFGQGQPQPTYQQGPTGPAGVTNVASLPGGQTAQPQQAPQPQQAQHPLAGALQMAQSGLATVQKNIPDYTCTMIKRERIDGKLTDPEYMYVKVRNEPFSVYMNFLKPANEAGREVIYVEGRNNGKLLAREGQGIKRRLGIVELLPTSAMAMEGNKYPITQLGVKNLLTRLIQVGTQDMQYGECTVNYRKNAKVNDRVCTIIEVIHPVPRRNFLFHKALIYVDDELNVPIRYEAYMWPQTPGGPAQLDEEYTYLNMKVNVGLTDADFDPGNPNYHMK